MKLLLWMSFLILLPACTPDHHDNSQQTLLQTAELSVQISPASIPVETPLTLTLETSENIQYVSAEIQGVSMYMGRIPLHWRKVDATANHRWQTEFLLGACTDPQMRWQLILSLTLADGTIRIVTQEFTSSW